MEFYLRLDVKHVDGPRRTTDEVSDAVAAQLEEERFEVMNRPMTARSHYEIEEAEIILADQLPPAARKN